MSLRIVEVTEFSTMRSFWPLIQQLNPAMTERVYVERLTAILKQKNYFQVARYDGEVCVGLTGSGSAPGFGAVNF